ncbi:type VI secretion system protein TssL, long form [Variovorax humicola]|uniref:Type VI secretion system protein TssL, long form n=1 Tax=Variovorax humicola TaxID=1769758 RepID=A0ABU8WD56_9BURK
MNKDSTTPVKPTLWRGAARARMAPAIGSPQEEPGSEDRADTGNPSPPAPSAVKLVPEPLYEERLKAVKAAVNPLLEAAQPLIRVLCEMPKELDATQLDVFRRLLTREVTTFQSICTSAQIKHEHMVAASYALTTAIDEAVQRKPWGGGSGAETGAWSTNPLAQQFHEDTAGGEKVFLLIGHLAASPQEHIDLIDLLFFILSLGFEGRYRSLPNGRRDHDAIRHRLYEIVMAARGEVPRDLSPHWKGVGSVGKFRLLRTVPVWVTVSLLSLVLLAQFSWYKYRLVQKTNEVETGLRAIGALRPPPAPVHKSLRLKELLAPEIARGTVSVEEDDAHSAVSFKGDDMFVPGQAQVNAKLVQTIAKVANEINEVSGTVRVAGHSDNRPIKTRLFPDNQALSERRAAAVAEVLMTSGVASERLVVEGKGDTQPVADNTTAAGRARNRRVDIVVTQGDAPAGPGRRAAAPVERSTP